MFFKNSIQNQRKVVKKSKYNRYYKYYCIILSRLNFKSYTVHLKKKQKLAVF